MKKHLSIILALVLVFALSVTAGADYITQDTDPKTGDTQVTYTVSEKYTVTIPSTIALSTNGINTGNVSVADALIAQGNKLYVTITAATNYNNGFRLKDSVNSTNTNLINYSIEKTATPENEPVSKGTPFLVVDAGEITGDAVLTFTADLTTIKKSGSYSDTVTFTVAVGTTAPTYN